MKKNVRRGFTLVELIVTLAIITILGTGLVMIAEPAFKTAREASFIAEDRQIAQSVMQQLKREISLAGAGSVNVEPGGAGVTFRSQTYGTLTVANVSGRVSVMCGTEEIGMETGAYLGRTADAAFEKNGSQMTITVNVYRNSELSATLTETVKLLNG